MITASTIAISAVFQDGDEEVKTPVLVWRELNSGAVTGLVSYGGSYYLQEVNNIPSFLRYEPTCP